MRKRSGSRPRHRAVIREVADSHDKRGGVLISLGRAQDALESYDRAIARDPRLSTAHDGRGTALAMLGRPQEALESHDRALALDPDSAIAHNNRGAALASLQPAGRSACGA